MWNNWNLNYGDRQLIAVSIKIIIITKSQNLCKLFDTCKPIENNEKIIILLSLFTITNSSNHTDYKCYLASCEITLQTEALTFFL